MAEAAEKVGMSTSGYIKLERGERKLSLDHINRFAVAFNVSAAELVEGDGDGVEIQVMGRVGAGARIEPEFEQVPVDGLMVVRIPFKVPDNLIAFEVYGESMYPRYYDGDVILAYREIVAPLRTLYGIEAAVLTMTGERYVKTIERGTQPNTVNLTSFNARPIENVRLEWWSEVYLRIEARRVQKIARAAVI